MRFARWTFLLAGIWGLVILLPGVVSEHLQGKLAPPPINHPEFFYGFYGAAIVWQLAFFVIARDPARFRPLMLVAVLEKLVFPAACLALLAVGRLQPGGPLYGSLIDLIWMALFVAAWGATAP
jgi:hypothetical protein